MNSEKRVFSRIKIPSNSALCYKNKTYRVILKNISLQGATIETEEAVNLAKGNSCVLQINPEGSDSTMDLAAMTMYCKDKNIGLMFSENNPLTVKKLSSIISSNFNRSAN